MSQQQDFYWVDEREPHLQRRRDILKAHPEVKTLFGKNPYLPYSTIIMVIVQVAVGLNIHRIMDLPFAWLYFILLAFFVGATISHALFLAIHEITHDLAFKETWANNMLSFLQIFLLSFLMPCRLKNTMLCTIGIKEWMG